MGKYLDLARRARTCDKSVVVAEQVIYNLSDSFGRLNRFGVEFVWDVNGGPFPLVDVTRDS